MQAAQQYLRENDPGRWSMLHTSVVPTMMKAGVGLNVIPSEAEAVLDIRALPDENIPAFYYFPRFSRSPDRFGERRHCWPGTVFSWRCPRFIMSWNPWGQSSRTIKPERTGGIHTKLRKNFPVTIATRAPCFNSCNNTQVAQES